MRPTEDKARRLGWSAWVAVAIAVVMVAVWSTSCGLFDTFRIETVRYTYASPDLPLAFDGVRVAFVSDIHRGPYYSQEHVGRLVDRVNALQTDLILLGGDYVYMGTGYESSCFSELERLRAPLGCYAVLGNHDYGRPDSADPGPESAIEAAAAANIPLLVNEGVWLEKDSQRIRIGGVADCKAGTSDLSPVVEGTADHDFVLLISHHPDFSEDIPEDTVDLVLSGHTHGGQVTVLGAWAPEVPSDYGDKYRTGMIENDATTVIVSNGVGTSTFLPIRIYAPAQIVVITLRSTPPASTHPWSYVI